MRALSILLLLAAVVAAGERRADLVFDDLPLRKGVSLVEGTRSLDDVFPYIEGLAPDTLPRFVGPIRDGKQAIAAARLFVAGPLVRTKAQADRIVAEARKLQGDLVHLKPKIADHRPEGYVPTAKKVEGGFEVSLVAFEMDANLQLVHVTAKVATNGKVELKRRLIVDGPITSWQTGTFAMGSEGQHERAARTDKEMRDEAKLARKRYAHALKPTRDLDTAWAIARLAPSIREVQALWGREDKRMGSGLDMRTYDLADGTSILFAGPGPDRRCAYIRHIKRPPAAGALHMLYTMRSMRR